MKKLLLLILIVLILTSCTPNEADFKSTVSYSGSNCGANNRVNCGADGGTNSTTRPTKRSDAQQSVATPNNLAINWDIPFFPQAPDADWGEPWQEACEEAASILSYYYISGKTLTKDQFKKDIKGLVEWQNKNFGDYKHTNISQTAEMIKGYFKFSNFQILDNPTTDQMKQYLSDGKIIIAPFAGRQLKNPFYSGLGPLYHMMVIKGYDQKHFITNDVGTKRGQNFIYPYQTIISAMHEWDDKDINNGRKRIIVLNR